MPEREIKGWYVKIAPIPGKPAPPLIGNSGADEKYPPFTKEQAEEYKANLLRNSGVMGRRVYRDEDITLEPIYGPDQEVGLGSNNPHRKE